MRVWLRIQKNVVLFKWVNFGENIWTFCWDKRNCLLYTGVHIKLVTISWGSTVYNILCQYDKSTLVSSLLWVAVTEICYSDSPRWLDTVTGDEKGLTSQLISTPPLLTQPIKFCTTPPGFYTSYSLWKSEQKRAVGLGLQSSFLSEKTRMSNNL